MLTKVDFDFFLVTCIAFYKYLKRILICFFFLIYGAFMFVCAIDDTITGDQVEPEVAINVSSPSCLCMLLMI